jgi:hypothetical protein
MCYSTVVVYVHKCEITSGDVNFATDLTMRVFDVNKMNMI